ncbi:DUF2914 domain-containing protein [Candidatus Parcubacteria bacterium]|nr:DUF2914 domain-containing protein [Candidatus Parcubacteria bacterium]
MSFQKVAAWYKHNERHVSSAALIGGFIFDILTLRRADSFWENFWVVFHLVVVASAMIFLSKREKTGDKASKTGLWALTLLQFSFGGLLSAFLILYFRSSTLSVSWPFLLILALAFAANERLKRYHERLTFQVSFLFLSLMLFMIFLVPVLIGSIGTFEFVLAGVLSLGAIRLFLRFLEKFSGDTYLRSRRAIRLSIITIFIGINALYFTNIIPPIPLSLKEGGIYHSVSRSPGGNYVLGKERGDLLDFLKLHRTIHVEPGHSLFLYSSVFSPAKFSTTVIHDWQYWNEESGKWVTMSRIALPIFGGRGNGYRTYSESSVVPGKWRVSVETPRGQIIGRVGFRVERALTTPEVIPETH